MLALLTCEQMRQADRYAIKQCGLDPLVLMEHAALAIQDALTQRYGAGLPSLPGTILVGPGNNGGDGLAVARLLWNRGVEGVTVALMEPPRTDGARAQLRALEALPVPIHTDLSSLARAEWVVDALFGAGLSRPVEGKGREWIQTLNDSDKKRWVVAVDVPSGLDGDRGVPLEAAVRASHTVTLGFVKRGLVTGKSADFVGRLTLAPIQIPRQIDGLGSTAQWWQFSPERLPPRRSAGHKGDYGWVSVVAGEPTSEGASLLSGWGALRSGAGKVSVVDPSPSLRSRLPPEILTQSEPAGVVVLGPGLGSKADVWVPRMLESDAALVCDADAITYASQQDRGRRSPPTIWTPHPKEAAGLLGCTTAEVEADRYAAVTQCVEKVGGTVVLKGRGTLIGFGSGEVWAVTGGNSALSKGGSGDLLAGVIGGLLAQGMVPQEAAALGVHVVGRAAERWSQRFGSERPPVTREIADELISVWSECDGSH